MQKLRQKIRVLVAMLMAGCVAILGTVPAWAEKGDVETSILPNDLDVMGILQLILKILVYGLGAAATIGVVIAGILYLTARDNQQQVVKAKTRLIEIAIGLVIWAAMFTVLNWLIPGFSKLDII